jgi:hypothetical protein
MTKKWPDGRSSFDSSFGLRYSDFVASAQLCLRQFAACHAEALAKAGDSPAAANSFGD